MQTLQFTIPASGLLRLSDPGTPNAGIFYQQLVIQNNNQTNFRVGDSTVSATRGILIFPTGSLTITVPMSYRRSQEFWVFGTASALVDVLVVD